MEDEVSKTGRRIRGADLKLIFFLGKKHAKSTRTNSLNQRIHHVDGYPNKRKTHHSQILFSNSTMKRRDTFGVCGNSCAVPMATRCYYLAGANYKQAAGPAAV